MIAVRHGQKVSTVTSANKKENDEENMTIEEIEENWK